MAANYRHKADISIRSFIQWDAYKNKPPDEALPAIYSYVTDAARSISGWYWASISSKRLTSLTARGIAFLLLILGTALQIYSTTLDKAESRLNLTQVALAAIAVAALVQLADKVFGWSSGWMRYITTVTTMENLCRAFELEWAKYLLSKTSSLDASDTKALFDLAQGLEQELLKLQADETTKWVAEFNSGISLLDSAIKTQREDTEKKLDAIRTTLASQDAAAKAEEKAKEPGSLEVAISHQAEAKKIQISMDDESPVEFLGTSWSKVEIPAGQHIVRVKLLSDPPHMIEKIAEIQAGAIARIEIKVPA